MPCPDTNVTPFCCMAIMPRSPESGVERPSSICPIRLARRDHNGECARFIEKQHGHSADLRNCQFLLELMNLKIFANPRHRRPVVKSC